jgi:hypothetical protein
MYKIPPKAQKIHSSLPCLVQNAVRVITASITAPSQAAALSPEGKKRHIGFPRVRKPMCLL